MPENRSIEKFIKSFRIIYYLIWLAVFFVIGRIIQIQYFYGEIVDKGDIYRKEKIEAGRGSILAIDGRPLATSMPYYQIRMDCASIHDTVFSKDIGKLANNLSKLFKNKSAAAYKKELLQARRKGNRYKLIGNRSIDFLELEKLKNFPIFNLGQFRGGLIIIQKDSRTHPYGRLAYRTIGYTTEDGIGVGIEGSFDHILAGKPGLQTTMRQLGGEWIPVNGEPFTHAEDGADIRSTIDIDIQESAENALREQLSKSDLLEGGTAIVMEVGTGAIRAIANMKKMAHGKYDESYNYAIRDATEPGSTMKLASLINLIEDGYVTLDSPVDIDNGSWNYAGKLFTDSHRDERKTITVLEAFESSSNVGFARLVVDHYSNNESGYVSKLHNLKINEYFNLDIDGEGRALLYTPEDKMWSKLSLPMLGIGYGLLLTPLHTLTFYNAIANNGKMMKPYFVDSFEKNGKATTIFSPQIISGSICSKRTVKEVKKALRAVVENGTAKRYDDKRYQISGKTGTAQIATNGRYVDASGYRRHQASFAGFFPSDSPKYSCIVVIYSNKTRGNYYGGSWALPVFKAIADKIYVTHPKWETAIECSNIKPKDNPSIAAGLSKNIDILVKNIPMNDVENIKENQWVTINNNNNIITATEIDIEQNIVPNVLNMGLKDALYLLENEGYIVKIEGQGRVSEQKPEPGTHLHKKGSVTIKLSNK